MSEWQQSPYVSRVKDGKYYNSNGSVVSEGKRGKGAHISIEKFNF